MFDRYFRKELDWGGSKLILETGKVARQADGAVVASYGRAQGAHPEKKAFDLYVHQPLPPSALLAVHTQGEVSFDAMGRSHPPGFIDVSIGFWKELTGEDD